MNALGPALLIALVGTVGCHTFMDTTPRGLQQKWLEWVRDGAIGQSIYECKRRQDRRQPCAVFFGSDIPLSNTKLPNGNLEDEYDASLRGKRCRYFYEYEPQSGVIVGFRFEESEPYACRITGV
jgi:hypothetical protein